METALISVVGAGFVAVFSAFAYFYIEDRKAAASQTSELWGDFNSKLATLSTEVHGIRDELKSDIGKLETGLRGDIGKLETGLRGDMGKLEAGLRGDMGKLEAGLRGDMGKLEAGLRAEGADQRGIIGKLEAGLRGEIADLRTAITDVQDNVSSVREEVMGEIIALKDAHYETATGLREGISALSESLAVRGEQLDGLRTILRERSEQPA